MELLLETGNTPLLVGVAGVGKTQMVKQMAEENGRKCIILNLSTMEPGDLLGLPFPDNALQKEALKKSIQSDDYHGIMAELSDLEHNIGKGKTEYLTPEWFPNDGEPALIFLDEINRSNPLVRAGVMQLVLDRRIMNHILPEGTWIAAAMNPSETHEEDNSYEVDEIFDSAFLDRFVPLKVMPDLDQWQDWAKSAGLKYITGFIDQESSVWEEAIIDFDMPKFPVTPRTFERLDRIAQHAVEQYQNEKELAEVFRPIATNILGASAGKKFFEYVLKGKEDKLSLDDVYHGNFREKDFSKLKTDNLLSVTKTLTKHLFRQEPEFVNDKIENVVDFLKKVQPETAGIFYKVIHENYGTLSNDFPTMFNNKKFIVESMKFLADSEKK